MSESFTYTIARGEVTVAFPAKPGDDVRAMLKANGFRWSPQAGLWWRRRVNGVADFLAALDRKLNPGRPDGACWRCKSPDGFFRRIGAVGAPVYCNACFQALSASAQTDRTDVDYEDACARACGL